MGESPIGVGSAHLTYGRRESGPGSLTQIDPRCGGGGVNSVRLRHASACVLAAVLIAPFIAFRLGSANPVQAAVAPCSVQWGTYLTNAPLDSSMASLRSLDNSVNRHSSIVHWYTQWGASWGTWAYVHPLFDNIRNYGSTPLLTWEAWGPSPYTVSNNTFPLKNIAAGSYDTYIDSWATGLRAYGYPVMMDVPHEMDGNWYPWGYGVNGNTQADYIAAYRHIHDRFTRAGATNVQWVWNPDAWNPSGVDQRSFYPGDAYVDWMAIDVYNWGAAAGMWESLAQLLSDQQIYTKLSGMSSKPMMFAEWGSAEPVAGDPAGVTKGQWIIDSASSIANQFTRIKAVVWFSENGTPFALNSSANSISGASTGFGGCGSPAPPPTAPPTAPPPSPPNPAPARAPDRAPDRPPDFASDFASEPSPNSDSDPQAEPRRNGSTDRG